MNGADSFNLHEALAALDEKCIDGYRVAIYYDPSDQTSWLTWTPPKTSANADAGRGIKGSIFEEDVFIRLVRQFVIDAERIQNLRDFQGRHTGPPEP